MDEFLLNNANAIRLACYVGILAVMAAWETIAPRRKRSFGRLVRWPGNIGIVVLNTLLLKIELPVAAVQFPATGAARGWSLLGAVDLPIPGRRGDPGVRDLPAACAVPGRARPVAAAPNAPRRPRFRRDHGRLIPPIEILLSMIFRFAAIAALGPSPAAVLVVEVTLSGMAMFSRANARLPLGLDRLLRWLVVTPDMHRVHHSILPNETNSNFGFNLSWWDRLFGTYRDRPAAGHEGMTIGIERFRQARELRLDRLLVQPFRGRAGRYAINRR